MSFGPRHRFLHVIFTFGLLTAPTLFLLLSSASAGENRWTTHGPGLANVAVLVAHPTVPATLYAGTEEGGVFKTTDGGNSWTAINTGLVSLNAGRTDLNITALAIDPKQPNTIYAGTADSGIFKSNDAGANWIRFSNGLTDLRILTLIINPETPTTLYVGTFAGVFKSTDGGNSWTPANTGLSTNTTILTLAFDPNSPTTLYTGAAPDTDLSTKTFSGGIFKSTDAGASWTPLTTEITANCLAIDPQNLRILYACRRGDAMKSVDGGITWTELLEARRFVNRLFIFPSSPTVIYSASTDGIFKSLDGGTTWLATGLVNKPNDEFLFATTLVVDATAPTTFYAGTRRGAFKSTDGDATWVPINNGLVATVIYSVAIAPITPSTVYAGSSQWLTFSTDSGTTWIGLAGVFATVFAIDPQSPATLYRSIGDVDGLFKSTDGGLTWIAKNNGLKNRSISTITIDPVTPTTLYVGTTVANLGATNELNGGIFKSTNGGETWTPTNTGFPTSHGDVISISSLAIDPKTPTILYAGVSAVNINSPRLIPFSNIFKSTDGGATWTALSNLPVSPLNTTYSIAIDPQTPQTIYAAVLFYVGPGGVLKSVDGGANWTFSNSGFFSLIPFINTLVIDPVTSTTLYAGTRETGVFKSTDSGSTWLAMNEGLTNLGVNTLAIDPTGKTLYAGTNGGGVFDFQIGEAKADLAVSQTITPNPVVAGNELSSTLTVTNNGPVAATNVVLTFSWPLDSSAISLVSVSPTQGTCNQTVPITCQLGTLATGAKTTVSIIAKFLFAGSVSSTASVTGSEADPSTANNVSTVVTTMQIPPGPDFTGSWSGVSQRCKGAGTTQKCTLSGSFIVLNQGQRNAPPTTLSIYLSRDSGLDTDGTDLFLKQFSIKGLKVGKSKKVKLKVKLTPGTSASGQFVIATIDAANTVLEMDESNNLISSFSVQ
jgi:uncharacterized repeat protein (TIGR01451 family)